MLGNRLSQQTLSRAKAAKVAKKFQIQFLSTFAPFVFFARQFFVFLLLFAVNVRAEEAPKFLGAQSCATSGCHGGADDKSRQYTVWAKYDVHHERPFATLTTARSERIAETLKLGNPTQSARCTVCHAPMQTVPAEHRADAVKISDGVSCENCHGPAENWIRSHTRKDYTHADRVHAGMRDLQNLYVRANTCVACHQNVDADILAAGHPELIFELDGQCVTQPKHWQETTNWNGAQTWLVGEFIALREMSWQLANEKSPTENQKNRRESALWISGLIGNTIVKHLSQSEIEKVLPPKRIPSTPEEEIADEKNSSDKLARVVASLNWTDSLTRECLNKMSDLECRLEFRATNWPSLQLRARFAERLVLALDRLTLALPDAKAADQLRAPLKKLFADVQSLPDFSPATFADHLAEFQKALPAAP